jgi:2-polyprenyl-3-methyl-5-hydroxy-6-metoxy-1,4-benzoquinol methylase
VEAPDRASTEVGQWFLVVQCQDCGLCFTNPRPTVRSIAQFYPDDYRPHQMRKRGARPRWLRWPHWWPAGENYRKVLPVHGRGRLLDFGCGGGSYLQRMQSQGWEVTGLDFSASTVARLRSELGLTVLAGTLPHPDLREPETFDVITMWQSLEHVHEPMKVLRAAHRLLAPGGKLVVAVPNVDSLPFRWFGQAWSGLDLPRHLTHFAPWTLRLMLHRSGFRTGRVTMVRHSSWLRNSARQACRLPHAERWHRWLCSRTPSNLTTWYSCLTRQSDCMMLTAIKK